MLLLGEKNTSFPSFLEANNIQTESKKPQVEQKTFAQMSNKGLDDSNRICRILLYFRDNKNLELFDK